jgi:hypothetical protein
MNIQGLVRAGIPCFFRLADREKPRQHIAKGHDMQPCTCFARVPNPSVRL